MKNLLTCHILEAFSVSNTFLSGFNFSLQLPHVVSQTDTTIQFSQGRERPFLLDFKLTQLSNLTKFDSFYLNIEWCPFPHTWQLNPAQFNFCYLLPKGSVKSKEVNMPNEYMASYQVPNTEYL